MTKHYLEWEKICVDERQHIKDLFDSGEHYVVELFTEEPRIIFDNGTIVFIEGAIL